MTGPYAGYILSAYGVSALALLGLGAWIVLDARLQKRALADLEARGIRRRSTGAAGANGPGAAQTSEDRR